MQPNSDSQQLNRKKSEKLIIWLNGFISQNIPEVTRPVPRGSLHGKTRQVIFYSFCPLQAPDERRLAIAEFITCSNYGLIIGNFELDFSDGEIRYKTSLDVEADRLTPALVKQLVYANVFTFDKYLPGILAVMEGVSSPEGAIASIEA